MPLVQERTGWSILLTARSRRLSEHPGELSFPGGAIEARDESAEAAALRETEEEIALPPSHVRIVGRMPDYLTFRNALVAPIVGEIDAADLPGRPPSSSEVEEIILVSLPELLSAPGKEWTEPGLRRFAPHAAFTRARIDHYSGRLMEEPRGERLIHYWRLDNGHTLWGITADITARFLEACFDWHPPIPPRRVRRREDVFPDAPD